MGVPGKAQAKKRKEEEVEEEWLAWETLASGSRPECITLPAPLGVALLDPLPPFSPRLRLEQVRDTYGEVSYLFLGYRELGQGRLVVRLDPSCVQDHKER